MRLSHLLLVLALIVAIAVLAVRSRLAPVRDSYDALETRILRLDESAYARTKVIGRSALGRPIYAVVVTDPRSRAHTRMMFIAGQHGCEPMPPRALMDVIDRFADASRREDRDLLRKAVIVFVPVVNPDGFVSGYRMNDAGVDLNRDWDGLIQPETKAVARLIRSFRPHVFADLHEGLPLTVEIAPSDGVTSLTLALARSAIASISEDRYTLKTFVSRSRPAVRLAHRYSARAGACSMLVESPMEISARTRQRMYGQFVSGLIQTAATPASRDLKARMSDLVRRNDSTSFDIASLFAPRKCGS